MPKIKLTEQEQYKYEYQTTIKIRDINYGGHLGNDALVGILHEARLDMLNKLDCSELNLGDGKTGIIIADLAVNYKNQGYLFDEITVVLSIGELTKSSFRLFYKILKNNELIALAENGIVAFDYEKNAIAKVPEEFKSKILHQ